MAWIIKKTVLDNKKKDTTPAPQHNPADTNATDSGRPTPHDQQPGASSTEDTIPDLETPSRARPGINS